MCRRVSAVPKTEISRVCLERRDKDVEKGEACFPSILDLSLLPIAAIICNRKNGG
jgi:hypothetical protein